MKNPKRLSRTMKMALRKMNKNPYDYLYTKKDHESFTPYCIKTGTELQPIRY